MASDNRNILGESGLGRHLLNEQAQAFAATQPLRYPESVYTGDSPPVEYHATPGELIERRRDEIQQYIQTLRDAQRICSDKSLMAEIRDYVQQERDALAAILDYIDLPMGATR